MNVRTMQPGDIPAALALGRASGWNQVAADWERLLALGQDGCLVAEVQGGLVGTVTAVCYQRRFAWIGMVLVAPAARGQGIGTALVEHALRFLGSVPARLDATPKGYPLYRRLGFVEESRLCRVTREAVAPATGGLAPGRAAAGVRRMRPADLDAVAPWDGAVFGADRGGLLTWAFTAAPELAWIAESPTALQGYCLGRRGHAWSQIGPVVARDVETASSLVAACVAASAGTPLLLDVAVAAPGWSAQLAGLGFVEQRPFIRMCRGVNAHPGERERQLAIFGPEWG